MSPNNLTLGAEPPQFDTRIDLTLGLFGFFGYLEVQKCCKSDAGAGTAAAVEQSDYKYIYYNNQQSNIYNRESIHSIYVYIMPTVSLHMSVLQSEFLFLERL